jgi:hypothetical protein
LFDYTFETEQHHEVSIGVDFSPRVEAGLSKVNLAPEFWGRVLAGFENRMQRGSILPKIITVAGSYIENGRTIILANTATTSQPYGIIMPIPGGEIQEVNVHRMGYDGIPKPELFGINMDVIPRKAATVMPFRFAFPPDLMQTTTQRAG